MDGQGSLLGGQGLRCQGQSHLCKAARRVCTSELVVCQPRLLGVRVQFARFLFLKVSPYFANAQSILSSFSAVPEVC
jgi:hypothetical protein